MSCGGACGCTTTLDAVTAISALQVSAVIELHARSVSRSHSLLSRVRAQEMSCSPHRMRSALASNDSFDLDEPAVLASLFERPMSKTTLLGGPPHGAGTFSVVTALPSGPPRSDSSFDGSETLTELASPGSSPPLPPVIFSPPPIGNSRRLVHPAGLTISMTAAADATEFASCDAALSLGSMASQRRLGAASQCSSRSVTSDDDTNGLDSEQLGGEQTVSLQGGEGTERATPDLTDEQIPMRKRGLLRRV